MLRSDPYNFVSRFVTPHTIHFGQAISEIRAGRKQGHWIWFLLPTPPFILNGLEVGSPINRLHCLRSDEEVNAYLSFQHPLIDLRKNYVNLVGEIETAVARGGGGPQGLRRVMGADDVKCASSLSLFERVARDGDVKVVCSRTLKLCR